MKTLIVYKSTSGHTEQYANLLGKSLNAKVIPLKEMTSIKLENFDTLIFGGCVHASRILGLKKFAASLPKDMKQNVVTFAVGANELSDKNNQVLLDQNYKANGIDYPFFYMQGGFDPDKLNFALKLMLQAVGKSIQKKADKDPTSLTEEDKGFLEFFREKNSHVSMENMTDLLNYMKAQGLIYA